ncbi:ATP11-domain-containing protein [Ramicandelaber brevisporus]|nr:ATP11-domain-containing protein [Ramicandelaber brevisporus]
MSTSKQTSATLQKAASLSTTSVAATSASTPASAAVSSSSSSSSSATGNGIRGSAGRPNIYTSGRVFGHRMASHAFPTNVTPLAFTSSVWANAFWRRSAAFVQAHGHANLATDYEAKYADKLKEIAEREGITVDELKRRALEKKREQENMKVPIQKPTSEAAASANKGTIKVAGTKSEKDEGEQSLSSIVHLDKLRNETPEAIAHIWNEFHASNPVALTAVIPADVYARQSKRSTKHPLFVLPLPRSVNQPEGLSFESSSNNQDAASSSEGMDVYYLQFQFNQCFITSLAEYKAKGASARPHLTLTFYTELAKDKDIVLMRGERTVVAETADANTGAALLTVDAARFLVSMMQRFYVISAEGSDQARLVEQFNTNSPDFSFERLVAECEKL